MKAEFNYIVLNWGSILNTINEHIVFRKHTSKQKKYCVFMENKNWNMIIDYVLASIFEGLHKVSKHYLIEQIFAITLFFRFHVIRIPSSMSISA